MMNMQNAELLNKEKENSKGDIDRSEESTKSHAEPGLSI